LATQSVHLSIGGELLSPQSARRIGYQSVCMETSYSPYHDAHLEQACAACQLRCRCPQWGAPSETKLGCGCVFRHLLPQWV